MIGMYRGSLEAVWIMEDLKRAIELGVRAEYLLDYGTMLASYGSFDAAAQLLQEALEMEPVHGPARKALAMVRKLQEEENHRVPEQDFFGVLPGMC